MHPLRIFPLAALLACGARTELVVPEASQTDAAVAPDGAVPTANTLAAPRPIAPLSTSHVTSRTPTVHWEAVHGSTATGTRVEWCRDRACTVPLGITDVASTVTSAQPEAGLPRGMVFWRLRSLADGQASTVTGPTWEFSVGSRSLPRDTSWGTVLDLNGDGCTDIAVSSLPGSSDTQSRLFIFYGSSRGLPSTPSLVLAPGSPTFGFDPTSAGDLDGDGFGDLVAHDDATTYIYYGSATGIQVARTQHLNGGGFGAATPVGDLDGDGYGDMIESLVPGDSTASRPVRVFAGGSTGVAGRASRTLPDSGLAVQTFTGFLDTDGDGRGEVLLAGGTRGQGFIALYSGFGTGGTPTALATLRRGADDETAFGEDVEVLGDVDGDGYIDIGTVLSFDATAGLEIFGAHDGSLNAGFATLTTTHLGRGGVGERMRSLGDVDGDGRDDVIVGSIGNMAADVYIGGSLSPTLSLDAPGYVSGFAEGLTLTADWNNDGFPDLGIGVENTPMGEVLLYQGSSTGLPSTPTVTLRVAGAERFGDDVI